MTIPRCRNGIRANLFRLARASDDRGHRFMREEPPESQFQDGVIARFRESDQCFHDLEIFLREDLRTESFGSAGAFGRFFPDPIFSSEQSIREREIWKESHSLFFT